jgi:hypothetical protein
MFLMDMLLTFFTGLDRGFEVITNKRDIAKRYLSTWFLIDFLATG